MTPVTHYFYSRTRRALPRIRAPRHAQFLLKGQKDPSMHSVTHYFYLRAQRALPCPIKSQPIGLPFYSLQKKTVLIYLSQFVSLCGFKSFASQPGENISCFSPGSVIPQATSVENFCQRSLKATK